MGKGYNLYNLEPQFKHFLVAENISPISLKNYLSDFRYFSGWLELYNRQNQVNNKPESPSTVETDKTLFILKQVDHKAVLSYRSYLTQENLPHKTINRRLSTLRKFCSFCISQGWMDTNPAKKIANITPENALPAQQSIEPNNNKAFEGPKKINHLISTIKEHFKSLTLNSKAVPNISNKTDNAIKPLPTPKLNIQYYIGILMILIFASVLGAGIYNQFFLKSPTTLAYPTSLTRAGRILSFQGRLTDTVGNPITTATNVTYSLYDVSTGGSPIYTSGACSTTPDQDGIINVLIGGSGYTPTPPTSTYNTVCGTEIDASIFTENANVYLGVTVASDAEMTPRQQIANVGYAINSETLQGFPPGTEVSTIPYINSDGNVLIAAATPGIYSTYSSSTFTLSSANATTIQSAGTGDITLQATESGAISFRTGGDTSTYTRLFIDTVGNGGNVGIGDLTPVATLTVGDGDLFQVAGATGNMTTAGDLAVNGGDITSTATTFNFSIGNSGTLNFRDGTNTLVAIKDQGDYAFWNIAGKSTTGDPATCSEGDIYYNAFDDTIKICHSGNTWEELDGGGSGSSVWSDLLSPTTDLLLNMITHKTEFNWDTGTGANNLFSLTTDASSNGTGYLMNLATGTSSTVKPLRVSAGGTESLIVAANGNVGIGDATPASLFTVGNGDLFRIDSTGRIIAIEGVGHSIDDVSGHLTLNSASTQISLNDNVSVSGTLTLPNSNTLTGVSGYTQFSNGISVGGGTTYYFNNTGDLRANTVSTGGTQRINSGGNLTNIGSTQFNGVTYTWPGADGGSGNVLTTNGTGGLSWYDFSGDPNLGPWTVNETDGTIYPDNSTLDLLIGGTATESAKFAFINVDSGDPTASISGNLAISAPLGADPATTYDILNGGTFNLRTSVGGNAGLTSRLFIDNDGNVGIGNNNPLAKLDINNEFTVIGTELVSNPGLTGSPPSDWTLGDCATYSGTDVTVTYTSCSDPSISTSINLVSGKTYKLTFTISGANGDTVYYYFDNNYALSNYFSFGNGTHTVAFNSDYTGADTIYFKSWNWFDDRSWTIDNVSVIESTPVIPSLKVIGYDGRTALSLGGDILNSNLAMGLSTIPNGSSGLALNTAFGNYALFSNTYGYGNGAFGHQSLYSNTTGNMNYAFGNESLFYNTTGNYNSAFGGTSLNSNTTGSYNSAFGSFTLLSNTTGINNQAFGYGSLYSNTEGIGNSAFGHDTLSSNTTGSYNVAYGGNSLNTLTTGSYNIIIGYNSGGGIIDGSGNVIIGSLVNGLASNLTNNIIIADGAGNQRINVLANGNVGIGNINPLSKLSIGGASSTISNDSGDITIDAASGNVSFNGNNLINFGQLLGSLGLETAPTYSFSGDADTGFFSPAADTLGFSIGGDEQMRINTDGVKVNGHMAIGPDSSINDGSLLYPTSDFISLLSLQEEITNMAGYNYLEGITNYLNLNPSGIINASVIGIDTQIETDSANSSNFSTINGSYSSVFHKGTGTISYIYGSQSQALKEVGSGDITSSTGIYAYAEGGQYTTGIQGEAGRYDGYQSATAGYLFGGYFTSYNDLIITSGTDETYGLYTYVYRTGATGGTINTYGMYVDIDTLDNAGSGTHNAYGLYLTNVTGADNNYSIYSAGGTNYFAGNVGINTTSPDRKLEVLDATNPQLRLTHTDSSVYADFKMDSNGDLIMGVDGSTNQLVLDNSGNVGIGTATPNASYKLHVAGNIIADALYDTTSPGTWFLNPGGASSLGGNITMVGDLYMIDGSPLISSNNSGTYNTITIKGSNDTTSVSLCVEGTGTGTNCDGKINAGTIDPPYTINGKKYATYLPSMTGVKEETTGVIKTTERVDGVGYRKIIDFNNEPDGSDLWLFAKTSNLKKNINDMVVLLTPADNTRTWFNVDKNNLRLTIYSTKPTTISYRLTSPRFDTEKWKNIRENDDPVIGFVLNDEGNLNSQGQPTTVAGATLNNTNVIYNGNLTDFKNQNNNFTLSGDFVDEFIASTVAVFARMRTGFIETQNIVVNNVIVANKAFLQSIDATTANVKNLIVQEKIISPVIETKNINVTETARINKIQTNEIKPQNKDVVFNLSNNNQTNSGQLAQLIIKGLEGKTVTTIDSAGNASFSGQITANSLSVANDATVAGTLTAGEIQSDNLTDIENRLSQTASDSSTLATSVNDIQKLLAEIKNEPVMETVDQTNLTDITDLTSLALEELTVTGNTNLYNLSVSNSISTGGMLIENNKILALSWDLNISALARINFFDGAVVMAKDGTITTQGQLIAQGGIRTNEIRGITDNDSVNIDNLSVSKLSINDKYFEATESSAIIAATDNFELNGLFAPAIETASSSAGVAILPENSIEVIIYNENIKEDSLIYLTPTSTNSSVTPLTVGQKEICSPTPQQNSNTSCKKYFKVVTNTPQTLPAKFNWLIVN